MVGFLKLRKIVRVSMLVSFLFIVLSLRVLNSTVNYESSALIKLNAFYFVGYAGLQLFTGTLLDKLNNRTVRLCASLIFVPISLRMLIWGVEYDLLNKILMFALGVSCTPAFLSCARGCEEVSENDEEFRALLGLSAGAGSFCMFAIPKIYELVNFNKQIILMIIAGLVAAYLLFEFFDFRINSNASRKAKPKSNEGVMETLKETYEVLRSGGVATLAFISHTFCLMAFGFFSNLLSNYVSKQLALSPNVALNAFSVYFFFFACAYTFAEWINKAVSIFFSEKQFIIFSCILRVFIGVGFFVQFSNVAFVYLSAALVGITSCGDIIMFGKMRTLVSPEVLTRGVAVVNTTHTVSFPLVSMVAGFALQSGVTSKVITDEPSMVLMVTIIASGLCALATAVFWKRDKQNNIIEIDFVEGFEPEYMTSLSAGMDLKSVENKVLKPGCATTVKTGVKLKMPSDVEAQVRSRSSLSLKGIAVINNPGTIDPDYRGEVTVCFWNHTQSDFNISKGERIAQLVFAKFIQAKKSSKAVRKGGLGSTSTTFELKK